MHGEENAPQLFFVFGGKLSGDDHGWDCIGFGAVKDFCLGSPHGISSVLIFPDQAVHGGTVHKAFGYREDGVVVAVGIDDFRKKFFRYKAFFNYPRAGDQAPDVGMGVRKGKVLWCTSSRVSKGASLWTIR